MQLLLLLSLPLPRRPMLLLSLSLSVLCMASADTRCASEPRKKVLMHLRCIMDLNMNAYGTGFAIGADRCC